MLSQRQAIEILLKLPLLGRLGPVFLRYLLVGGAGFLADAVLLEIFVRLGVSVYAARILSMTLAMGCTYALHRNFTFTDAAKPARSGAQIAAFVSCQLVAAAVNYGVFCLLLWLLPQPVEFIGRMFALCWGVGAGLAVNFVLLRLLVFPADGAAPYERLMPKSPWRILPWVFAIAALLHHAFARQAEVTAWPNLARELGPADPDIWMRLAEARQWMNGEGGFFSHAVPNTNAPLGGIESHWTRPLDALLAFFAGLMPGNIDAQLLLAAAWLPPVLGFVALMFLVLAAVKRFDNMHVIWCVLLLAAASPLKAYFLPGDADHHGLLAMLWCGVIALVLRPLSIRAAVAAGALLGVMVWVSIEALLPLAAVYALLGWFTLKTPARIKPLAIMAASVAMTAALGLAIEMPPEKYFSHVSYDTLSIAHVALLFFIAIGAGVLCLPKIAGLQKSLRLLCALNAAVLAFLAEIAFFPKILFGPMVDADYFITQNFLATISEAQGLFGRDITTIISHLWQPVLAACLIASRWRGSETKKSQLLPLAALLAAGFVMVAGQGRWTYYLQPVAIVAIAALLPAWAIRLKWLKRVERPFRPYACLFGAVLLSLLAMRLAGSVTVSALGVPHPESALNCQSQMRYIVQTRQLQEKLGDMPAALYAPPEIGGDILFFTPYKIIAGNYHREGAGLRAFDEIARDKKPEEARRRLEARGVGALFFCPATQNENTWLRRVRGNNHPDWLAPLGGLKYLSERGAKPLLFIVK